MEAEEAEEAEKAEEVAIGGDYFFLSQPDIYCAFNSSKNGFFFG